MNIFCTLEKDNKTFNYFKEYLFYLDSNSILYIDNKIQHNEIINHLKNNGYSDSDTYEITKWINKNAKNFRKYLNTIKLIFIIIKCSNININDLSFEQFCKIEDKINSYSWLSNQIFM